MKRIALIGLILFLALAAFSCAPADTLGISVNETVHGIIIENTGDVDCIVFVTCTDVQQQFDLAAGERITLVDIPDPIEVSAVKK